MVEPSTIITGVISLGKILLVLKASVQKLPRNRSDIYALAIELINDSDELLDLRRNHGSARVHELDRFLESLIKRLREICNELDTLTPKHSRAPMGRLYNTGKNICNADSVKDKIIRLREQVASARQSFLVKNSLSMALNLDDLVKGPILEMQENIWYLVRKAQGSPKDANKMFGVDRMSIEERKSELRKSTLDLQVTMRECERSQTSIDPTDVAVDIRLYVIQTKIRTLQESLDTSNPTLCNNSNIGDVYDYGPQSGDPFYDILKDPCEAWQQPDALLRVVELLNVLQNPILITTTPAIILWERADRLSLALSSLGLRKEALQLSTIGYDLIRHLSQPEGDSAFYRSSLARSLKTLSTCRRDMGDSDGSLVAIQEAVPIYRGLVMNDPGAFHLALAISLSMLSRCLSHVKRKEEAFTTIQEAVRIIRDLVKTNPGVFNWALAFPLCRLSSCLNVLGRNEEARVAIQEAVQIYRELVKTNPGAFLSGLACSLSTLYSCLGGKEGLAAIQESVEIFKGLVKLNASAFNSEYARSLYWLSCGYGGNGRKKEALIAIQEAVGIYRLLYGQYPAAYLDDFAVTLDHLGHSLRAAWRFKEARSALKEASRIRRQ